MLKRQELVKLVLITLLTLFYAANVLAADKTVEKTKQLKQVDAKIERLQRKLSSEKNQAKSLDDVLKALEENIADLSQAAESTSKQLTKHQQAFTNLKAQVSQYQQTLNAQLKAFAVQMREAYVLGHQQYVKVLLNQQDPASLSRMLAYYGYFTKARLKLISELKGTLKQLADSEIQLQIETAKLEQLQADQQKQTQALKTSYQQRKDVVAKLRAQIISKEAQLTRLQNNRKQLQQVISKLQAEQARQRQAKARLPFRKLRGKLPWPTKGQLIRTFGKPIEKSQIRWNGDTIAAPAGQAVHVVAAGKVIFAKWLRGYGFMIIVSHNGGYMSLYGHNQSLAKKTGDVVHAGDVIALTGDSGGQQRTGVYFEIRHRGKPVNPRPWLRRRG